jgi:hypothetical protein
MSALGRKPTFTADASLILRAPHAERMALEADKAGSRRESAVWGGMTDEPKTQRQKFTEMVRDLEGKPDEKRLEDRLKPVAQEDVPVSPRQGSLREKPGPAKNGGDETPNPLPDNPSECGGEGGGDSGRAS